MRGLLILLGLTSIFLLLALVMVASSQTRTVGVNVGNKWRYSLNADWSSDDPTATPPSHVVDYNATEWLEVSITDIAGTNATGQIAARYKNGTEETSGGWIDVDTGGNSNMTYFIVSANLSPGDSLYTLSFATWLINETVPRSYLNSVRDTNHINITLSSENQHSTSSLYWDKETGIFVDLLVENTNQTGNYTTSWSIGLQIISSNLWVIPEFSTLTVTLLALIMLTSATMIAHAPPFQRAH